MRGLLQFLYRFRVFEVFVVLEVICVALIIQNNRYHNVAFFSSSNTAVANLNDFTNNAENYFELQNINQELANENAKLRSELAKYVYQNVYQIQANDTLYDRYEIIPAKVINNSLNRSNNYFTIDKGSLHGVAPGMGVVSSQGVAGQVKNVTANFATVSSLIHSDLLVSSVIKKHNAFCTTQWDGTDPRFSSLKFVPRHLDLMEGDTIVTSGFNSVFPANLIIGTIESFSLNENQSFYDVRIKLSEDFQTLNFVYVTKDRLAKEIDSLTLLNESL